MSGLGAGDQAIQEAGAGLGATVEQPSSNSNGLFWLFSGGVRRPSAPDARLGDIARVIAIRASR